MFWDKNERVVDITCPSCHSICNTSMENLALALPEGQDFLRSYPRVRTLPRQYVETDGCAAIIAHFESVPDNALFAVVFAYDTYKVLRIHREGSLWTA